MNYKNKKGDSMSIKIVIGAQWGDEGKGKIVDYYAEKASWWYAFTVETMLAILF